MGGGAPPVEGDVAPAAEGTGASTGTVVIEGGGDFPDEPEGEPNFNRDGAPLAGSDRPPSDRPHGDRPHGGDRGGRGGRPAAAVDRGRGGRGGRPGGGGGRDRGGAVGRGAGGTRAFLPRICADSRG